MISLTSSAANHVQSLMRDNEMTEGYGLRVGVSPGGCSGYSYLLDIDEKEDGDEVFVCEGVSVFIDSKSYKLLDGLQIDFEQSMLGGGFKFSNPNATKSCGCGTSFC